jgi:hypothetical protein
VSGARDEEMHGDPDGSEEKALPKDDRGLTEAAMEDGLPEAEQRKPRTGPDAAEDEA